jgi:hypothetical protein
MLGLAHGVVHRPQLLKAEKDAVECGEGCVAGCAVGGRLSHPFKDQREAADKFGLDLEKVRVLDAH